MSYSIGEYDYTPVSVGECPSCSPTCFPVRNGIMHAGKSSEKLECFACGRLTEVPNGTPVFNLATQCVEHSNLDTSE
jgi:hypothetical protein